MIQIIFSEESWNCIWNKSNENSWIINWILLLTFLKEIFREQRILLMRRRIQFWFKEFQSLFLECAKFFWAEFIVNFKVLFEPMSPLAPLSPVTVWRWLPNNVPDCLVQHHSQRDFLICTRTCSLCRLQLAWRLKAECNKLCCHTLQLHCGTFPFRCLSVLSVLRMLLSLLKECHCQNH
mgnify:CR=1 FL=1